MANSTERSRRMRDRARRFGLCISCCKRKPRAKLRVCQTCKKSISKYRKRRQERNVQHKLLQVVRAAHERAGDVLREHNLYDDAAQHYWDALSCGPLESDVQARLTEKLAEALPLSGNAHAAGPVLDDILATRLDGELDAAKSVKLLRKRAYQLWVEARTSSAVPLLARAIHIAQAAGNNQLLKIANCKMADYLMTLGRYCEARSFFQVIAPMDGASDADLKATWHLLRGIFGAAFGDSRKACSHFDAAVVLAKTQANILSLINFWRIYGFWATQLGDIKRAKACYERALLSARQYHVVSQIPLVCLDYAGLLSLSGQHGSAHSYLLDALSYDANSPQMDCRLAATGIPIAMQLQDDVTLSKCARPEVIDLAFRSGQKDQIASIAAAFAQWYDASGSKRDAQILLHKASALLRDTEAPENVWTFPIAVARYGLQGDFAVARQLLEKRASFQTSSVARACLHLFDAFAAERDGRGPERQMRAAEAHEQFKSIGWYGYAQLSTALFDKSRVVTELGADRWSFEDSPETLTRRERQVAELVLRGLSNREIAVTLSIKERTVETHMTAIMSRLGVRSRHQLAEHLPGSSN